MINGENEEYVGTVARSRSTEKLGKERKNRVNNATFYLL